MDKQSILEELKRRNVTMPTNDDSMPINNEASESQLDRKAILQELKNRGLEQTKSGKFLPTREKQIQDDPYGLSTMVDDMEIAPSNATSKAVEDYLTSKEFGRLVLEVGGAIGGTMAGPVVAPAFAVYRASLLVRPVLTAAITRMAGAGVGEGIAAGVSNTFDPRFDSRDDFATIAKDITKDVLRATATGATAEGAGTLITKAIGKVIGKNKKLVDGAEEAVASIEKQKAKIIQNPKSYNQEVKDAVKVGQLTPGLLQKGQVLDTLENISELSIIGGGTIRYAKEGADTIAQSGLDDFVKLYQNKTGDAGLGNLFQKTLTNSVDEFKRASNANYNRLDVALKSKQYKNVQVDLTKLKTFAAEELKNIGSKSESANISNFLKGILGENNKVSFKKANNLRSDYLEISREFAQTTLGSKKKRLASVAGKEIDEAINGTNIPVELRGLLKDANTFYREGAEVFNSNLFESILKKDPELVYRAIVPKGADRDTLVKKTFAMLDKKVKNTNTRNLLKNKIRGEFLKDVLTQSQKSSSQFGVDVDGAKLRKLLDAKDNTLNAMFSKTEVSEIKKLQNAILFSQGRIKKKGNVGGAILIQMKQSGAIMQLAGGGVAAGTGNPEVAAAILLGPAAISQVLTKPKIVRALTLGYKHNDNPKKAQQYFLQAVAQMTKENIISEEEAEKIKLDIKESNK